LNLSLASLVSFLSVVPAFTVKPEVVILVLGVWCACNAVFRGLDVVLLRPRLSPGELLSALVLTGIAVVALTSWRNATVAEVALLAGAVVFVGGLSLAGRTSERPIGAARLSVGS
jgi:hypothetical protein